MATWIYCRVSSKEQAVDGASLPDQARECQRYCKDHGLDLGKASNYDNPGVFADPGVSAWKIPLLERPGFQKLWVEMKPGDNVVFLSLDRAFRSVQDFSRTYPLLENAGITPIFVRSNIDMRTATGRLMAHVSASFAQFKSDIISQRVKEGYKVARLTGKPKTKRSVQAANDRLAKVCSTVSAESKDSGSSGRVFGYIRVSTTDQNTDAQRSQVNALMDSMVESGYIDTEGLYIDHGVSAYSVDWRDRPYGSELFSELQEGDCVVVSRIDRIFRSVHDMAGTVRDLVSRGVHLVTCCGVDTRTPDGQNMIEILGLMATWESREMSWRIKLAMKNHRALKGKWKSQSEVPRYMKIVTGVDGTWTAQPDFEMIEQYREVAELLNAGHSAAETSDLMEQRLAAREGRPVFPQHRFDGNLILRRAERKGDPYELLVAIDRWLKQQKPNKAGHVERDWSYRRVLDARKHFAEIDSLLNS